MYIFQAFHCSGHMKRLPTELPPKIMSGSFRIAITSTPTSKKTAMASAQRSQATEACVDGWHCHDARCYLLAVPGLRPLS